MTEQLVIRKPHLNELEAVFELMQALAKFESYFDNFKLTTQELEERLFNKKDFSVLIALVKGKPCGLLTYYLLPFTYDLKSWMFIKELYVNKHYRKQGVGKCLMEKAAKISHQKGVTKIKWNVLKSNHCASEFYTKLGANVDVQWQGFFLDQQGIKQLAIEG